MTESDQADPLSGVGSGGLLLRMVLECAPKSFLFCFHTDLLLLKGGLTCF